MSPTVEGGTLAEERAEFPVKLVTNFQSLTPGEKFFPFLSSLNSRTETSKVDRMLPAGLQLPVKQASQGASES